MSNYSPTTDFAQKDSLPSGDSGKIIRGTEFETEFDNIATAVNSKSDANNPTFTGTVTIDGLTVNGNTVLGNAATDTVTVTADIASNLIPSVDDTYNLGAVGAEWNDLFIDGVANIDNLVADTADINGGTVDGVTIGGSSAGAITGTTITGTSFVTSGDMTFGDYDKAVFGAGSDLQIYHSGLHSYITDTGAGNLYLGGSDSIWLGAGDLSETYATFNDNGAVTLRHDNAPKLATTSTGIDVTGTATMDGLTVDGTLGNWSVDTQGAIQDFSASGTNYIRATNAAGSLRFGSGGVNNRLNIANNGDVSLYEDTGTTAKFFWDSSAESLGIGTSSPDATLHANKTAASGDAPFIFENSGTSGTCTSSVVFAANGGGGAEKARIKAAVRGDGYMAFHTNNDTEKMRIDSSGNVGIGTDSPSRKLHIKSGQAVAATIESTSTSTARLAFVDANTTDDTRVGIGSAGDDLQLLTANAERMRIDSSGHLIVPNGVTLGTAVGTYAAAKTLDDYEEGTWIPVFEPTTGSFTTMTMDVVEAKYTKIGNAVTISVWVRTDNVDTTGASGALRLAGLPFNSNSYSSMAIGNSAGWGGDQPAYAFTSGTGSDYITLQYKTAINAEPNNVATTDLQTGAVANQNQVFISGTYFTTS